MWRKKARTEKGEERKEQKRKEGRELIGWF